MDVFVGVKGAVAVGVAPDVFAQLWLTGRPSAFVSIWPRREKDRGNGGFAVGLVIKAVALEQRFHVHGVDKQEQFALNALHLGARRPNVQPRVVGIFHLVDQITLVSPLLPGGFAVVEDKMLLFGIDIDFGRRVGGGIVHKLQAEQPPIECTVLLIRFQRYAAAAQRAATGDIDVARVIDADADRVIEAQSAEFAGRRPGENAVEFSEGFGKGRCRRNVLVNVNLLGNVLIARQQPTVLVRDNIRRLDPLIENDLLRHAFAFTAET